MTRLTGLGDNVYISFKGVVIDTLYRSFDPGTEEENVDVSAGGDTLRVYAPTLRKIAPSASFIYDTAEIGTAVTKIFQALTEGNEGTLLWAPAGTSTGMPKWGINARVSKFNPGLEYDGETEAEVEFINIGSAFYFDGRTAVW